MSEPYLDSYEALGLPRTASADEIKRAYFALVRANPPERNPAAFKRIRAAYERLRDPAQRLEADMLLLQSWPAPVPFGDASGVSEAGAQRLRRRRPPELALAVGRDDILAALRALTDLDRADWREQYEKVQL
jgi:curved DNA-binding protein CbpA